MTRLRFWFLLPARVWFVALFFAPLAIICAYSLLTRGVYGGVESPWTLENYRRLIDPLYGAILLRSILLSAAATAICIVLAFPLALFISRATRRKSLYLHLVILPFWTSFLVRTYAWMFLLREAAADLGARPWATFFRVIVPLAKPGIWAGAVLVFIPCLGSYLTPDLLGGGKSVMIGNLVQNQFTTARDWPFGSAVSLTLMLLTLAALAVVYLRGPKEML
jgi:spermidine/putrescine transport system permease protein